MTRTAFTKTILYTLLVCVLITVLINMISVPNKEEAEREFPLCTVMPSTMEYIMEQQGKFVGDRDLYWPKHSTVKILIIDGNEEARQKVMNCANEWAVISGLQFERVYTLEEGPEIRVSFNCKGYSSLVGKQALDQLMESPTMCLQKLDQTSDEELFRRTVLHEFGHVMGLLHELQNPTANIPWNLPKLYAYYENTYEWDTAYVNKWVLHPALEDGIDFTQFDTKSIMMYAVPDSLTNGQYSFDWPKGLSTTDKQKIRQYYN